MCGWARHTRGAQNYCWIHKTGGVAGRRVPKTDLIGVSGVRIKRAGVGSRGELLGTPPTRRVQSVAAWEDRRTHPRVRVRPLARAGPLPAAQN